MMPRRRLRPIEIPLSLLVGFSLLMARPTQAEDQVFYHENVLGTSLEIRVRADSDAAAKSVEEAVLAEVDRLAAVLSSYDPTSEFSTLLAAGKDKERKVSFELFEALRASQDWIRASNGAFNPAIEVLSREWSEAQQQNRVPSARRIEQVLSKLPSEPWKLDATSKGVNLCSDAPLTLNAIAKGIILDRAANRALASVEGCEGLLINIGGDLRVAGSLAARIEIASPKTDALGAKPLTTVQLSQGAVATSGASERHYKIEGQQFSHIIDPRTGAPVDHTVSATVIADTACTADAVATICNVMTIPESLAFVNALPGVDCLLVASTGVLATSSNWPQSGQTATESAKKADTASDEEATGHEMLVEFEIGKPSESRRYRRPYVAVWIEDKDKYPVKTLSLFLMQNNPGPRWYRDVRRWYSDDQLRKIADPRDIIATVSKPTRNPGKYKVTWDGRDDAGKLLKEGKYTLLIEAAREHGTYQLIKHEFEFGKAFKKELKGNVEIASASASYQTKSKK